MCVLSSHLKPSFESTKKTAHPGSELILYLHLYFIPGTYVPGMLSLPLRDCWECVTGLAPHAFSLVSYEV